MKNMKIKHGIMKEMRISNYEKIDNIKLWKIWEYQIMNNMRIYKLWMIWEYINYEWYENI